MIPEADTAAVLRKAAEGLRDPEQVVLDPWNLFEDAHGVSVEEDEAPCRACAIGHIVWATAGGPSPVEMEIAVTDAVGSHHDLTTLLDDEGATAVADLYDRVADGLEAAEESA
jgi:hypothetical protein